MVNVANGNLLVQVDDMDLPERGIDLAFRRTYNSQSKHDASNTDGSGQAIFGNGWTTTFDAHLAYNAAQNSMSVYDIDGARYDYPSDGSTGWTSPAGMQAAKLTPAYTAQYNGNTCYDQWTKKNGTAYIFARPDYSARGCGGAGYNGRLVEIFARNSQNWVRFDYYWRSDQSSANNISEIDAVHADGQKLVLLFQLTQNNHNELAALTRYPDQQSVTYAYSADGNLTDVCEIGNNGPGQTTSDGVCSSDATHPHMRHQYAYNSGTYQLSLVDSPNFTMQESASTPGTYTQFTYDGAGRLGSIIKNGIINPTPADGLPGGALQSMSTAAVQYWIGTYSGYTGTTSFSDTDGHTTSWEYDGVGRVTQTSEATGSNGLVLKSSASWDSDNDVAETVDARGFATDYAYDASGNTIAVAAPQVTTAAQGTIRPTTLYAYLNNNVVAYCDPNSNANAGRNWSGVGTPPVCPNAAGATRYTWATSNNDLDGYLTDSYTPLGYHVHYSYDTSVEGGDFGLPTEVAGDCVSQNDATNLCPDQKFTYDSNGRGNLVSYNKGTGGAWTLTYDPDNRVLTVTDPDSTNYTSYRSYFPNGQVQKTETAYQHATGTGSTTSYDADGNAVSETVWHGGAYNTTAPATLPTAPPPAEKFYDAADRLIEVVEPRDPTGASEAYTRNWATRYIYDAYQQNSTTHPGPTPAFGGQVVSGYGNLYKTEELLGTSDVATFTTTAPTVDNTTYREMKGTAYDALDRPTITYSYVIQNGADTLSQQKIAYDVANVITPGTSNNYGEVSSVCNALQQCTYDAYDNAGQLNAVSYSSSTALNKTLEFDAAGHAIHIAQPAFGTQTYAYDADGRETQSSEPTGGGVTSPATITYHYYANGQRSSLDVASYALTQNGLFTYSYRADGKIQTQQINMPSDAQVGTTTLSFSYSPAGRLNSRSESGPGGNATPSKFYYDPSYGYLTEEDFPGGKETSMQYDPSGAMLGEQVLAGSATSPTLQTYRYSVRGENIDDSTLSKGFSMANGVGVSTYAKTGNTTTENVDVRMGIDIGSSSGNSTCSSDSSTTFDGVGRLTNEDNSSGGSVDTCTTSDNATARTYDQENHTISAAFTSDVSADGNAAYDWGPNGHPIRIGETSLSTTPGAGAAGYMAYETLHWDGNTLLFTTNAGSKLDDIKVGTIGDITPLDPTYKGLTFWDRDPSSSLVYCHNATGAGGNGIPNVRTLYGVKTGRAIHSNPCRSTNSGQAITAPSNVIWWADGQSSPRMGWDGILGMPRGDGLADGFDTIQGVRTYDASTGSWTTPDAYAGTVHDPMSQKSYVWNNNNPIAYEDPSGYLSTAQQDMLSLVLGALRAFVLPLSGRDVPWCTDFVMDIYKGSLNIDLRAEQRDNMNGGGGGYETKVGIRNRLAGDYAAYVPNLRQFFANTGQLHSFQQGHSQVGDILFLRNATEGIHHVAMISQVDSSGHPTRVVESHGNGTSIEDVSWSQFQANMAAEGDVIDSVGRDDNDANNSGASSDESNILTGSPSLRMRN